MCETAALLVEHRLPAVPWRQWVLSFEGPMAAALDDLGLFVHLHALVTDGCFEAPDDQGPDGEAPDDDTQEVRFLPTEQLAGEHLLRTLQRLHADLAEHVFDEGEPPEDGIAACVQLGLGGVASGPLGAASPVPCVP